MKKLFILFFTLLAAVALTSCDDDNGFNVIDTDDGTDDEEPAGMVYSISFNVEGTSDTFTFTVDMTDAVIEGEDLPDGFEGDQFVFDPEEHDVYIAGGFPGDLEWNQPGTNTDLRMTTSGGTAGTIAEGDVPFKFFIVFDGMDFENNEGWNYGEWEAGANREATVEPGATFDGVWGDEPEEEEPSGDLPEALYVPGSYQPAGGYGAEAWIPAEAPPLRQYDTGKYEGHVYMPEGGEFKFTAAQNWDEGNWGGADGTLEEEGDDIAVSDGGFYFLEANLNDLTYQAFAATWAIIGDATPGGWDEDTDMTFNEEDRTWTITEDLVAGNMKFRANDSWDVNYGDGEEVGQLVRDGADIPVEEDGNYTIVLDLNGDTFTYTVTKN